LSDADIGAFTPGGGALSPLLVLLITHLEEITGMDPAIVPVSASADPPPFTILVGDRCGLTQHQLSYLLCPYPRLGEHRCDCRTGYRCWHHNLGVTGSFPLLPWMRIRGTV
jgi:hypothetical protein